MAVRLTFAQENRDRIQAVENSFGPSGKPLSQTGRVLIGEGRLMKQSRRGSPQPKVFFLFSDVLVYGSILLNRRWHKKQKIIPLEDIQLEDLADGIRMKNQWLIRTPRKSFYVAASSLGEKRSWMEYIESCKTTLLQSGKRRSSEIFAVTWIPDQASAICMRCSNKFSLTQRRHHCRQCGFVVCEACSKNRVVIPHMHPTKLKRVCNLCHSSLSLNGGAGLRDNCPMKICSEEEDVGTSSEEEVVQDSKERTDSEMEPWSVYVYFKPEHASPRYFSEDFGLVFGSCQKPKHAP